MPRDRNKIGRFRGQKADEYGWSVLSEGTVERNETGQVSWSRSLDLVRVWVLF